MKRITNAQLKDAAIEQAIAAHAFETALRELVEAHKAWRKHGPPINGTVCPAWTRYDKAWECARSALRLYGKEAEPVRRKL